MEKRGQVTIFIILGIVIIIVALGVSFIRNDSFKEKVEGIAFRSVVVPEQAQGVVNYINGCVEDIAEKGIEILSLQGGYIEIPDEILRNTRSHFPFTENIELPYWLYGESTSKIPELEFIELQLKDYIEQEFRNECGLQIYDDLGYDVPLDLFEVEVFIEDGNIVIDLISELKVDIKEEEFDLKDFVHVDIDSRLHEFYTMAREILYRELGIDLETGEQNKPHSPFEYNTLNMIALWSKEEDNIIPKPASIEFGCTPYRVDINEVGEELSERLSDMVRKLQLEGSVIQDFEDPFYQTMILDDVFSEDHDDVFVQFKYEEGWPFSLDVRPKRSNNIEYGVFIVPCLNKHEFRYYLSYPLVVVLEVGDEFFNFAVEVFVEGNYGRTSVFEENVGSRNSKSLFCDENQRNSEEITVIARDSSTGDDLEGTEVTYICGFDSCFMGKIEENDLGEILYSSKFPSSCYGGEIKLHKEGYGIKSVELSTLDESSQTKEVSLEAYKELNLDFKVIDVDNGGVIRELKDAESVALQLNKINEISGVFDETIIVNFEKNNPESSKIRLISGNYHVSMRLDLNEEIELEGVNSDGLKLQSDTYDGLLLSYVEFAGLELFEDDLLSNNIEFRTLTIDPKTVEDVNKAFEMNEFVELYRGDLDPVFS
jgi:hypothetical protein